MRRATGNTGVSVYLIRASWVTKCSAEVYVCLILTECQVTFRSSASFDGSSFHEDNICILHGLKSVWDDRNAVFGWFIWGIFSTSRYVCTLAEWFWNRLSWRSWLIFCSKGTRRSLVESRLVRFKRRQLTEAARKVSPLYAVFHMSSRLFWRSCVYQTQSPEIPIVSSNEPWATCNFLSVACNLLKVVCRVADVIGCLS